MSNPIGFSDLTGDELMALTRASHDVRSFIFDPSGACLFSGLHGQHYLQDKGDVAARRKHCAARAALVEEYRRVKTVRARAA